ncbi:MAG: AraC family transcriptional regulator [Lachnospiraceae bacterium]|nr:AraC family transcriptional regulator [Lachnospiraceae bacterium]
MPINMPRETLITVQKRDMPYNFQMPQMEMAEVHYSMVYIISGDRRVITPYEQFDAHAGDITSMPPKLYHRTFSLSNQPYSSFLIKLSEDFAKTFIAEMGAELWTYVFEQKHFTFDADTSHIIEAILQDMFEIYESSSPHKNMLLKGAFYRLAVLMRDKDQSTDVLLFKSILSGEIMEAMYYIEQHYDENILIGDVSDMIGFSGGHFSRLFSSQVGIPFSRYLINVRIRHAKELLINTDMSISDIALSTGFNSGDYMSACFGKYEGMTPTTFRHMSRQNMKV